VLPVQGTATRAANAGYWHSEAARRSLTSKRLVVAHVDPDPAGVGLAFGQDRDRGVVPVQSLGTQHVGLETLEQRCQRRLQPPTWSARVDRLIGTPSLA
jgi:hypothetical protein